MSKQTRTVLVTGANRGIGLELTRQLIARGDRVIATARKPGEAPALQATGATLVPLDLGDPLNIATLGGRIGQTPIDVLINNAGVSSTSKTLGALDAGELAGVFMINAIAPMLVCKAVLEQVRAGSGKLICQITSQLASIANNTGGSSYGYRASKAALNQMNRSLAAELKRDGITCVAVHPGWVRTDMGGPNATLSVEESARAILLTLDEASPEQSGAFLNYDGVPLPW